MQFRKDVFVVYSFPCILKYEVCCGKGHINDYTIRKRAKTHQTGRRNEGHLVICGRPLVLQASSLEGTQVTHAGGGIYAEHAGSYMTMEFKLK